MVDAKKLRQIADAFIEEAGRLRDICHKEEDYDDVVDIIQDVITGIPRSFALVDYYTRWNIQDNVPDDLIKDEHFMDELIENLNIEFNYDDVNDYITQTAEELKKEKYDANN